jgi:DNA-binding protein
LTLQALLTAIKPVLNTVLNVLKQLKSNQVYTTN